MDSVARGDALALAAEGALPVVEAARFLGISRSRLYELMQDGEVRFLRIGRRRVVPRVALREFLADRLANPSSQ
jgi:excisionase family DNA binding protein